MNGLKVAIIVLAAGTLAACTTTENTVSGAGIGAAVGAIATNSAGGAVAGALIGGFGTFLIETADGKCQYRNSKGKVYTTRCHWRR
jgi:FlaG/FlaF family flagellin (archaellin)